MENRRGRGYAAVSMPEATAPARSKRLGVAVMLGLQLVVAPACSRNPATGRLQFGLINEQQELQIGKETDAEVLSKIGAYTEQPAVEEMVTRVGQAIAKISERPDLPWTFAVLDDPTVNAFAVPGGYVYVTRGLLGYLRSEAELAAVLGHEAGHVTARHSAVQLRKQRTAANTVGVFRVIDPNLRHVGGIAAGTAGLALLKHSRDDENEADALGLRYMQRTGYDPAAIVAVFDVLASVDNGSGRVPNWLLTHPQPEARRDRVASFIGPAAHRVLPPDRDYLSVIDGIVYGKDPRQGFLLGNTYVNPRMQFSVDAPADWAAHHDGSGMLALSPKETALFVLSPAKHETIEEGLESFFDDPTITRGETWKGEVGGVPMQSSSFALGQPPHRIVGLVGYLDLHGRVLAMVAISPEADWEELVPSVGPAFSSFRVITDPALLLIEPMRIRMLELPGPTTLEQLQETNPSVVSMKRLERLNRAKAGDALASGQVVKRVEGVNPDDPQIPMPRQASVTP
jgi:predicted Zn-dependent protease